MKIKKKDELNLNIIQDENCIGLFVLETKVKSCKNGDI